MNYLLYDDQGLIVQFTSTPDDHEFVAPNGLSFVEAGEYGPAVVGTHRFNVVTGELESIPATLSLAAPYQIKAEWLRREQLPVQVSAGLLDCDTLSESRIRNVLAAWDILSFSVGNFDVIDGVSKVGWVMADNTKVWLSYDDLQLMLSEMLSTRALRASRLFSVYQMLKSTEGVTQDVVYNDLTWA